MLGEVSQQQRERLQSQRPCHQCRCGSRDKTVNPAPRSWALDSLAAQLEAGSRIPRHGDPTGVPLLSQVCPERLSLQQQQQQRRVTQSMAMGPDSLQMLKFSTPSPREPGEGKESKAHVYTCTNTHVHTTRAVTCTQVLTPPASARWFVCLLWLDLGSRSSTSTQLGD